MAEHPHSLGYGAIQDGEIEILSFKAPDNLETVMGNAMDVHQKGGVVFHLREGADVPEDDEQPYPILGETVNEGQKDAHTKIYVAAFIASPCANYEVENDAHTGAYHACREYLTEEVKTVYIDTDGDLDKMRAVLDGPAWRRNMMGLLVPNGSCALMIAAKEPKNQLILFTNKIKALDEPEFWTSDSCGWTREAVVEAKATPPANETLSQKLKRERAEAAAAGGGKGSVPAVAQVPTEVETKPKTQQQIDHARLVTAEGDADMIVVAHRNQQEIAVKKGTQLWAPDKKIYGRALEQWYKRNFGWVPDDYASQRPALPTYMLLPMSPSREFVMRQWGRLAFLKPGQTEEQLNEEIAKQAEANAREAPNNVAKKTPPLIPAGVKKELRGRLDKVELMSAEQVKALQDEYDPASKQLEMPFEMLVRMSFDHRRSVGNTSAHALACMAHELACYILTKEPKLLDWKPAEPKAEEAPAAVPENETLAQKMRRERLVKLGEERANAGKGTKAA